MSSRYGKMKRHELKSLIEKEYCLKVKGMHEGDRGILAYTDKGTKLVRQLNKDDSKILFAASAYEHLANKGFEGLSRINRSEAGKYFVEYNEEPYVLQDYVSGKVLEVRTPGDAAQAAGALAELHRAGEGFVPVSGSRARVDWGKWMEKFKAQAISIKKYIELAEAKTEKTRFDKLFLKYAAEYYDRMYSAYLILKNNNYMEKVHESMNSNQITHKELKKHALLRSDQGLLFVTNMENCGYDIREVDLATLLESFPSKSKNRAEMVTAAIRAYSEVLPLDGDSIKIIQAFLVEPKKFFKILQKYYGRRNGYTEAELINKLERSLKKEARKEELLAILENIRL